MNDDDKSRIWIPKIVFDNNPGRKFVKITPLSALSVKYQGQPHNNFNFEINEFEEFRGNENPLVFENIYDLKMNCKFDFHYYPFDTQQCFISVSDIHVFFVISYFVKTDFRRKSS